MRTIKIKIKKIFLYILLIVVFFLVMTAICSNRYKFASLSTIKYIRINLENSTNINDLANKYSDNRTKEKFVSEIKRINNMGSLDYISGNKTIIIPLIED
jgi:type IV secretory pathway VirB3-like protein